jgi:hypothetical protein
MKSFLSFLGCSLFVISCADSAESDAVSKQSANGTYADYKVWAEEGQDDVTVRLQYSSNEEGLAFALPAPGKVLLDGEGLAADSTRFNGVFYEVSKPIEAFRGWHTITMVDVDGKEHKDTFTFSPFTLTKEISANIKKKPFSIVLDGLPEERSLVRLVMIDTDYESADVNEEVRPEDGVIVITEEYLSNLTKGPIVMELYLEVERPLSANRQQRGQFSLTYALRRQFNLVE